MLNITRVKIQQVFIVTCICVFNAMILIIFMGVALPKLVVINPDGAIVGRVYKARLAQYLRSFVTLLDNERLLVEPDVRHRSILDFFKRHMEQVFVVANEGMRTIAEQFLVELSDKITTALLGYSRRLDEDAIACFVNQFIGTEDIAPDPSLAGIMRNYTCDLSNTAFITTERIRSDLLSVMRRNIVCFVTDSTADTFKDVNRLFDFKIDPSLYYDVQSPKHNEMLCTDLSKMYPGLKTKSGVPLRSRLRLLKSKAYGALMPSKTPRVLSALLDHKSEATDRIIIVDSYDQSSAELYDDLYNILPSFPVSFSTLHGFISSRSRSTSIALVRAGAQTLKMAGDVGRNNLLYRPQFGATTYDRLRISLQPSAILCHNAGGAAQSGSLVQRSYFSKGRSSRLASVVDAAAKSSSAGYKPVSSGAGGGALVSRPKAQPSLVRPEPMCMRLKGRQVVLVKRAFGQHSQSKEQSSFKPI
jgi:hypothetical protein